MTKKLKIMVFFGFLFCGHIALASDMESLIRSVTKEDLWKYVKSGDSTCSPSLVAIDKKMVLVGEEDPEFWCGYNYIRSIAKAYIFYRDCIFNNGELTDSDDADLGALVNNILIDPRIDFTKDKIFSKRINFVPIKDTVSSLSSEDTDSSSS